MSDASPRYHRNSPSGEKVSIDGIIDELTWEQVEKVRHAAARNAFGGVEAVEMMQMLGIYPGQDNPAKIVDAPDPRPVPTRVR